MFKPKPFRMGMMPRFHPGVILLNQHAEFDAGFAIAMIA